MKSQPEVILRARRQEGRYMVRETVDAERDRLWALAMLWTPAPTEISDDGRRSNDSGHAVLPTGLDAATTVER